MEIILLGTAAGGGFPQWNCWCPGCRVARTDPSRAHPRTQSSVAVSGDGTRWALINASPDVRDQLDRIGRPHPADGVMRYVPVEAVVLTDAELDHSLGLMLLREARAMTVYATQAVLDVLERDSRILPTVRAFANITIVPLPLDREVALLDRAGNAMGITIEAFAVDGDAPRFASADSVGLTAGLLIRDGTRSSAAYVPGCGALTPSFIARIRDAYALLFDGTFWSDDELITLGISPRRARDMGHLPIGGPDGSLAALTTLEPGPIVWYTHINNTNPILIEDSPERRVLEGAGAHVGRDGQRLTTSGHAGVAG